VGVEAPIGHPTFNPMRIVAGTPGIDRRIASRLDAM
jgi:hypothetical protein